MKRKKRVLNTFGSLNICILPGTLDTNFLLFHQHMTSQHWILAPYRGLQIGFRQCQGSLAYNTYSAAYFRTCGLSRYASRKHSSTAALLVPYPALWMTWIPLCSTRSAMAVVQLPSSHRLWDLVFRNSNFNQGAPYSVFWSSRVRGVSVSCAIWVVNCPEGSAEDRLQCIFDSISLLTTRERRTGMPEQLAQHNGNSRTPLLRHPHARLSEHSPRNGSNVVH